MVSVIFPLTTKVSAFTTSVRFPSKYVKALLLRHFPKTESTSLPNVSRNASQCKVSSPRKKH